MPLPPQFPTSPQNIPNAAAVAELQRRYTPDQLRAMLAKAANGQAPVPPAGAVAQPMPKMLPSNGNGPTKPFKGFKNSRATQADPYAAHRANVAQMRAQRQSAVGGQPQAAGPARMPVPPRVPVQPAGQTTARPVQVQAQGMEARALAAMKLTADGWLDLPFQVRRAKVSSPSISPAAAEAAQAALDIYASKHTGRSPAGSPANPYHAAPLVPRPAGQVADAASSTAGKVALAAVVIAGAGGLAYAASRMSHEK